MLFFSQTVEKTDVLGFSRKRTMRLNFFYKPCFLFTSAFFLTRILLFGNILLLYLYSLFTVNGKSRALAATERICVC